MQNTGEQKDKTYPHGNRRNIPEHHRSLGILKIYTCRV